MVEMMNQFVIVSKYLSYLLRHHPDDLPISKDGFVSLTLVVRKVQKKFPQVDKQFIEKIVQQGNKRFEIKNNQIRALYGHSIPVTIQLDKDHSVNRLYHGTSKKAAEKILKTGLKSKGRNKVHLSTSKQEAIRVGKRHSSHPVILQIDVNQAQKQGFCFQRATENVYVSDFIPSRFISKTSPD